MLSDVLNLIFKDKPSCQITDDGIKVVNNTSLDDSKMQQRKYILERCLEFLRLLAKYMHIIIIHINTYVITYVEYVNFGRDNMTVKVRLFDHMDDLLLLDVAIPQMADLLSEVRMLSLSFVIILH